MKKYCVLAWLLLLNAVAYAAAPAGNDVTNKPELYYSTSDEALDSLAVLPQPPAFDSILFQQDKAMYEWGLTQRDTERGRQAASDAPSPGTAAAFSEAFGCSITAESTPELFRLIQRLRGDLGDLATRAAKRHYYRVRPYVLYNAGTCYPEDEDSLRGNGSYPSGHSSRGWGIALVLAEIHPQRKERLLQRGYEIGQSRVICGYHWQSDVDAGRLAGAAGVALLHTNPAFMQQLQKAKEEFARLRSEGKIAD